MRIGRGCEFIREFGVHDGFLELADNGGQGARSCVSQQGPPREDIRSSSTVCNLVTIPGFVGISTET
jgi:hypothetical protein